MGIDNLCKYKAFGASNKSHHHQFEPGKEEEYRKQQIASQLFQRVLLRLASDAASSTRLSNFHTQFHSLGADCLVLSFLNRFRQTNSKALRFTLVTDMKVHWLRTELTNNLWICRVPSDKTQYFNKDHRGNECHHPKHYVDPSIIAFSTIRSTKIPHNRVAGLDRNKRLGGRQKLSSKLAYLIRSRANV